MADHAHGAALGGGVRDAGDAQYRAAAGCDQDPGDHDEAGSQRWVAADGFGDGNGHGRGDGLGGHGHQGGVVRAGEPEQAGGAARRHNTTDGKCDH